MKLKATYTRRILAKMYFPDCEPQNAVRRLTSEIKRCVELYELLTAKGKRFDNKQILTIREVKLIEGIWANLCTPSRKCLYELS